MIDGTSHSVAAHTNNSQSSKYSAPCRAGAGGKAIAMRTIPGPKIIGAISSPPYVQSSPPMPDAEGAQSPPAAHRDDSLATNPSAGLVAEDHPPKRRRGGWGRAGVFAVAAWLAWLAWPTAAFAQATLTLSVDDDIAGDDTINIAEKANGFPISGDTGAESGVTVEVTIGTGMLSTTSVAGDWSVDVGEDEGSITGTSVSLSVTATKTGFTDAMPVSRTLTVDLTAPTVSYTAPLSLTVGDAIMDMVPTKSEDIDSYAISGDPLLRGLSLNGATGVISGTPTTGNRNTQRVEVLATDEAGNTGTAMIDFPPVAGPEPGVTVDPPAEELPMEGLLVPEDGSVQYTLVLDTEPTHEVRILVSLTTSDDDLTAAPTTLTFTTGNWDVERTVTVSAADDDDGEAGVATIKHNAVSDDSVYDGIPTPGVKATEEENDEIEVIISPTALSVPEGGSATYTVRLGTKPLEAVTVDATRDQLSDDDLTVSSDTDTDTKTDSVTLLFTDLNWNTGQTVTVSAAEDNDQVNDVAIFSHNAASSDDDYNDIPVDPVTATEADNDRDVIKPTAEIQTEVSALVGGAFEVTIRFSESVRGFTLADISVSNGTASDLNRVSSRSYTVKITPEETGEVRVEVRSNVARDGAGNGNRAAEPLVIEADLTGPEVAIASEAMGTVNGAFEVTIAFSEEVTGFEQSDISVSNGTASNFNSVSAQTYTVTVTPEETGEVRVEVGSNAARDGPGNGSRAAEPLVIEADLTGPEVAIASEAMGAVNGAFEVTISFSEEVTGFEQSEILVTNGLVTRLSGSGGSYTAEITPAASGEVTVEVGAAVAEDGVGNGNEVAEPFSIEADLERPEVTIKGPTEPVPVGAGGFEVKIAFSEPVAGFESEDIQVDNGTVASLTEVRSSEYLATIGPARGGQPVVVRVPENVAEDEAGNGNRAAEPFEVEAKLVVSYEKESYTATEGGEAVAVTVKLSQAAGAALAIPIRVTKPEATEDGDYTVEGLEDWDTEGGAGTLTFAAEETEHTFRIAANHDGDGDDETLELGLGELPEIAIAGDPTVATVTLEDKGLVELEVSFGQAAYEVKEGQRADIEVSVSPAADRRVDVPLAVALQGGTTPEDYGGVPASVVFELGESERIITVEALADEVNDPGEGIVLILGGLPEAVSAGDPSQTQVHFGQQRSAEQFSRSLEGMLAVIARSTAVSAQTAIEGRFERHRQWSRLGSSAEAMPTPPPGNDNGGAALSPALSPGASERIGREGGGGAEGSVAQRGGGATRTGAATESGRNSANEATGMPRSWLREVSLGSLASLGNLVGSGQSGSGFSTGSGMEPGGIVHGQARLQSSGVGEAPPEAGDGDVAGLRDQELNLSGVSFEASLGRQEEETSWAPVLWGQGDLQHFNGDLTRRGMEYRGDLNAAHVGLDLHANDRVLVGLSLMRSLGDLDYTADGVDGVLESDLSTAHPYLYWQPSERVSVWGIGGFGGGEVDVREPGRAHDFDADFRMFAGGVRAVLSRRDSSEWGLRADGFQAQLETSALEDIAQVSGEAQRGRLMLEWVHDRALSAGRSLSVKLEAGGRFDGGDAERGAGMETGFRLGFLDANRGLDVAMHGRVLVVHESDYRDWGVGLQASWDPGKKQRGFRASLTSSWGHDGGGRTTVWDNADAVMRPAGMKTMGINSQYRMESEVAYAGLKAPGLAGLLTPYGRLRTTGQGRELALGTAWSLPTRSQQASASTLEWEATSRETGTGTTDLAVLMRMSIPF